MPLISHIQKSGFLIMPLKIKSSYLAQTKALISCATTVQSSDLHLCFHICKSRFSHEAAHLKSVYLALQKCGSAAYSHMQKACFLMIRLVLSLSIYHKQRRRSAVRIPCICTFVYVCTKARFLMAHIKYSFKHKQRR